MKKLTLDYVAISHQYGALKNLSTIIKNTLYTNGRKIQKVIEIKTKFFQIEKGSKVCKIQFKSKKGKIMFLKKVI